MKGWCIITPTCSSRQNDLVTMQPTPSWILVWKWSRSSILSKGSVNMQRTPSWILLWKLSWASVLSTWSVTMQPTPCWILVWKWSRASVLSRLFITMQPTPSWILVWKWSRASVGAGVEIDPWCHLLRKDLSLKERNLVLRNLTWVFDKASWLSVRCY